MADAADMRRRARRGPRSGWAATETVAEALLVVPHHVFVPEVPVEAAYRVTAAQLSEPHGSHATRWRARRAP